MPYVHTWEKHGVYRRFYGTLAAKELVDSSERLAGDARFGALNYDLSDYLQVKDHDVTPEEIDRWIPHFGVPGHANADLLVALVSADESVLRVLRELKARSEAPSSVEIFARAAEARDWIARRMASRGQGGAGKGAAR
jgi:hypothetical protein